MKKNIIKSIIAMVFVVGAIVSFNVDAKAYIKPDCAGGSCTYSDQYGSCSACCPADKNPSCNLTGCTCE